MTVMAFTRYKSKATTIPIWKAINNWLNKKWIIILIGFFIKTDFWVIEKHTYERFFPT